MDACRRTCAVWFIAGLLLAALPIRGAVAEEATRQVIEVRIENRKVVAPEESIRVTQGNVIELRWTSDEAVELHLHGYDVTIHLRPNEPASMAIEAHASGRFPITSHGWGDGGHDDETLTYLEVYPG